MELDLAQAGANLSPLTEQLHAQVCVIGAGIAGLTLAEALVRRGIRVMLLEAGGREASPEGDPFAAELEGEPHHATREGRVRALGGTSRTWGGQLLPLPADAAWPVSLADLLPFAEDLFPGGAPLTGSVEGVAKVLGGFTSRMAYFLPFGSRNLAHAVDRRRLFAQPGLVLALHAQAVELVLVPDGSRVAGVRVRCGTRELLVQAGHVVVATGTVEACRLLLASQSVQPGGVGDGSGQLGRFLHDHLTMTAGVVEGRARGSLLRALRPTMTRRRGGWVLGSPKLEAGPTLRRELRLPATMVHLTVEEPAGTGVRALREFLRARQGGAAGGLGAVLGSVGDVARIAVEAQLRGRRYVSPRAIVRLQLNLEAASARSCVRLSEALDANGMPKAVVAWHTETELLEAAARLARELAGRFESAGLTGVRWNAALVQGGTGGLRERLGELEDARHTAGGARMGLDPATSVVDADLRVHGVANLSVASAAVFPDGAAQLPTWTLMALCRRLAQRLADELG